jgi:pre-mRNA-processing factor 6
MRSSGPAKNRDGRLGPRTYNSKAPANYVAGLGRGAAGFTTQMDLGPAQSKDVDVSDILGAGGRVLPGGRGLKGAPQGYRAGVGRGATPLSKDSAQDGDIRDYTQFDPETGYTQHSLFNTRGGEDDDEADRIYAGVDDIMAKRHKRRREELEKETQNNNVEKRPKLAEVLAPYKASLSAVTEDEWASIPDVGDHSLKYKAPEENFTPMPASFIEAQRRAVSSGAGSNQKNVVVEGGAMSSMATPIPGARGSAHRSIDGLASGVASTFGSSGTRSVIGGHKSVDPQGYLTSLASLDAAAPDIGNVGDVQKNRRLFRSLRESNPHHGPSWISGAKLEESCGRLNEARSIIHRACNACPNDEEVWLEALRLHPPDSGRNIAAQALRRLPKSVNLWLRASSLERGPHGTTSNKEKVVLRRGLETIPNSVRLWEAAISLEEDEDDARIMLSRAVECVPESVNMWLALARLETYDRAKQVLNNARKRLPTELRIWITAAQLEESHGNGERAAKVMARAIGMLKKQGVTFGRDKWRSEAKTSELEASLPIVASTIVKETLYVDMGEEGETSEANKRKVWTNEAKELEVQQCYECARVYHEHLVATYGKRRDVWLNYVKYERNVLGAPEEGVEEEAARAAKVATVLQRAVQLRPNDILLWLMSAKEAWKKRNDVDVARSILEEAFVANPNSEELLLAGSKIEQEEGEYDRARILLARARECSPSARVWTKSITIERLDGQLVDSLTMLKEGREKYPTAYKLWMSSIQVRLEFDSHVSSLPTPKERRSVMDGLGYVPKSIRNLCNEGLTACSNCVPLWLLACTIEEKAVGIIRARSMLEVGRQRNTASDELWHAAIELEIRAKNEQAAESLMAKALEACPTSGLLASKHIEMAPRGVRQSRALALLRSKRYDGSSTVLAAVGKMLWSLGKGSKARSWFEKAINANSDDGDVWSEYLAFEIHHGATAEQIGKLISRCVEADPKHGSQLWCPIAKKIRVREALMDVESTIREAASNIVGPFEIQKKK